MHPPFEHAAGDHSKQINPCLYVGQNYRFQFKIVIAGKWTVIDVLFIPLLRQKKKNQKSKTSKIPRSFLLI